MWGCATVYTIYKSFLLPSFAIKIYDKDFCLIDQNVSKNRFQIERDFISDSGFHAVLNVFIKTVISVFTLSFTIFWCLTLTDLHVQHTEAKNKIYFKIYVWVSEFVI